MREIFFVGLPRLTTRINAKLCNSPINEGSLIGTDFIFPRKSSFLGRVFRVGRKTNLGERVAYTADQRCGRLLSDGKRYL